MRPMEEATRHSMWHAQVGMQIVLWRCVKQAAEQR